MRCAIKTLFVSVVAAPRAQKGVCLPPGMSDPPDEPETNLIRRRAVVGAGGTVKLVVLVVGLAVLAVGLVGALYGLVVATGAQTEHDFLCTTGPAPSQFCAILLATVATYRTLALVMGLIALGGLVLVLAGALMPGPALPPAPMYAPMPPPLRAPLPTTRRMCVRCGRANLVSDRFCMNCGSPL